MKDAQGPGSEYLLREMTTEEHLAELRYRLIVSLLAVGAASVVVWFYVPSLLRLLAGYGGSLVFVSPSEAFFTRLKVAVVGGAVLMFPILVYQGWRFTQPALFPGEQDVVRNYLPAAVFLFVLGLAFGFVVVFPLALRFFLGFGTPALEPALAVGRLTSFVLSVTFPFGLVFQLPLVVSILARLEMVSRASLLRRRKMVYFLAFVVAAMLTPADVASQVLLGGTAMVLYEVGVWLVGRQAAVRQAATGEPRA